MNDVGQYFLDRVATIKSRRIEKAANNAIAHEVDVNNTPAEISLAKKITQAITREKKTSTQSISSETQNLETLWTKNIYEKMLELVDVTVLSNMSDSSARRQIRDISYRLLGEMNAPLNAASRDQVVNALEDEIMGLGPLEDLLKDPQVSDILVNGPNKIYVERKGKLELTNRRFSDTRNLMKVIDKIVSSVGRRIDELSPMVDARLKDGSRVNIIIPPLALDGPTISIRRFSVERLSMAELVEFGSIDESLGNILQAIVKLRLNVLISGGTGSGKTTLLNVLSSEISEDERIVTIEDSAELQLQQPHIVRLETRPANIEGRGEITQRELVKNCLRMRPDRIIIGEVRGAESLDMLQAMNTGHDGSLTTVHANTARDALARIENMITMYGAQFPVETLRQQIASAINIVIQVQRLEDGTRKIMSVEEVTGTEGHIIIMSPIYIFQRQGVDSEGKVKGRFRASGVVPNFYRKLEMMDIHLPIDVFKAH
ncbi:MAG: CpaF family protein [Pseudomonadota bacterium]